MPGLALRRRQILVSRAFKKPIYKRPYPIFDPRTRTAFGDAVHKIASTGLGLASAYAMNKLARRY